MIKDLGLSKLRRQIARLSKERITVGVQGSKAKAQHPNADASVGQVAAWTEYGTPGSDDQNPDAPRSRNPARPFLRTTFARHGTEMIKSVRKAAAALVDGRVKSVEEAQDKIGTQALDFLRATMDDARSWAVPNADSTIERKGHDQPVLDSGAVRDATTYAVRDGDRIIREGDGS